VKNSCSNEKRQILLRSAARGMPRSEEYCGQIPRFKIPRRKTQNPRFGSKSAGRGKTVAPNYKPEKSRAFQMLLALYVNSTKNY